MPVKFQCEMKSKNDFMASDSFIQKKNWMVAVWVFSTYCIVFAKLFKSNAEIKTETPRIMQKVKINVKYLWSKRKCIKNATTPMNLKRDNTIKMGFNHTPNVFIVYIQSSNAVTATRNIATIV